MTKVERELLKRLSIIAMAQLQIWGDAFPSLPMIVQEGRAESHRQLIIIDKEIRELYNKLLKE